MTDWAREVEQLRAKKRVAQSRAAKWRRIKAKRPRKHKGRVQKSPPKYIPTHRDLMIGLARRALHLYTLKSGKKYVVLDLRERDCDLHDVGSGEST